MGRYRVVVRRNYVAFLFAPNFSKAVDMAKQEFGKYQSIEFKGLVSKQHL